MSDERSVRVYHYSDPTQSIDAILLALGVPGENVNHNTNHSDVLMSAIHRWASTALAGAIQNVGGGEAGYSAAAIERRKQMFLNLPSREAGNDETATCAICLEAFKKGEKISGLLCEHEYHAACLWPWMETHNTCPVCRFRSF